MTNKSELVDVLQNMQLKMNEQITSGYSYLTKEINESLSTLLKSTIYTSEILEESLKSNILLLRKCLILGPNHMDTLTDNKLDHPDNLRNTQFAFPETSHEEIKEEIEDQNPLKIPSNRNETKSRMETFEGSSYVTNKDKGLESKEKRSHEEGNEYNVTEDSLGFYLQPHQIGTEKAMLEEISENYMERTVTKTDSNRKYTVWRCKMCSRDARDKSDSKRHISAFHRITKCEECNFASIYLDVVHAHEKSVHFSLNSNKYSCKDCEFNTGFRSILKQHFRENHRRQTWQWAEGKGEAVGAKFQFGKIPEGQEGQGIGCNQCDNEFASKFALSYHRSKYHTLNGTITCEICGKTFNSGNSLKYHLRKHYNVNYKCKQCEKVFQSKLGLNYHLKVHKGIREHLCTHCGQDFRGKTEYLYHVRSQHTFERPYVCDTCNAAFFKSGTLLLHIRKTHTGEKAFSCRLCNWKGFSASERLHHKRKHKKQNTSESASEDDEEVIEESEVMVSINGTEEFEDRKEEGAKNLTEED